MTKIEELRNLWWESGENAYASPLRRISNEFMRKHVPNWIFNSRVENFKAHLKYRMRLRKAVGNPEKFQDFQEY